MLPFILISLIVTAISWVFYCKYLERFEKMLEWYKFIEIIWIERDLERLRLIIDVL